MIIIVTIAAIALSVTNPLTSANIGDMLPNKSDPANCDSTGCPIKDARSNLSAVTADSEPVQETSLSTLLNKNENNALSEEQRANEQLKEKLNSDLQAAVQRRDANNNAPDTTRPVIQTTNTATPETNTPIESGKTESIKTSDLPIKAVEEVIALPENFAGLSIGIKGTVVGTYPEKQLFTMGCSCRKIPVEYTGEMPVASTTVTAYGKVMKQAGGGYVFKADSIK